MRRSLLLSLICTPVFAYETGNINVQTGYGTESLVRYVTSPVDIITEEEINEKHPFSFKDIIYNRNGFSFSSYGGFGQTTSIYLWGTNTGYTTFMIDGIRIFDPSTVGFTPFYEHILIDDVRQIEIIKGVQSGIWGADAIGGVINIVTEEPETGFHTTLKGTVGDYNTKKAGINLSYANKKVSILLDYYRFKTSGFSAAEPVKGDPEYGKRWDEIGWERDPYKNETVNFKTRWNITENDRFQAVVRSIDAVVHYDAGAGVDARDYDNPWGYGTSKYFYHYSQKSYKLQYDKKVKNHHITALYSKSDYMRTHSNGYEGRYIEYTVKDKYSYETGFLQVGFSRQDFINQKSDGRYINKRYHNNGYFITNVINIWNSVFSQSVRHDSYSSFKDKTTYKIGVKHFVKKDVSLSANYGTGYKVPSLYQRYGDGVWVNPNPELKPENSIQWDIGLNFKDIHITYFHYSIKNMIDYTVSKYENIKGKTKIRGIDASYSKFLSSLNTFIRINYTYLDSKNGKTDKRLIRRPLHQIGFDIVWVPDENVNIGFSGIYVDKRKDIFFNSRTFTQEKTSTGYYTVINAYANFQITKNLLAYVKLNNITDKYYQTVAGYASEGRSVYAGFDISF